MVIYPDGFVKVVDLDELVTALESRSLSLDALKSSLLRLNRLLAVIYAGRFHTYTVPIENLESPV